MAVLNSGTILAVAEETVIGGGKATAWANGDVIPFQDDSGLTPATESLERSTFNGSFINCQALSGNESTSGNLNLELGITPVTGTEAGKLLGHLIYKSGLGVYVEQAADVTSVANEISQEADPILNPTDYDLYRLSKPTEARTTLAVREYVGGTGNVIDSKGVVVDSLSFDFSAGQIVKVSNSVSGIAYTPLSGQVPLVSPTCGGAPFVTKSAVFLVEGTSIDAQNVSFINRGVAVTGDVTVTNAGVTSIGSGVIVNADVNASAGVALTKLAATTASRALVSDGSGFITSVIAGSIEISCIKC